MPLMIDKNWHYHELKKKEKIRNCPLCNKIYTPEDMELVEHEKPITKKELQIVA